MSRWQLWVEVRNSNVLLENVTNNYLFGFNGFVLELETTLMTVIDGSN